MVKPMLEAIVAVYADWGIGNGTTQPVVLSADRAHFRSVTGDAAVIVGRKTLEDFPGGRPLKGRHNIIVTRQDLTVPGAEVVHSTEEALSAAEKHPRCLVLGDELPDWQCTEKGPLLEEDGIPYCFCLYERSAGKGDKSC